MGDITQTGNQDYRKIREQIQESFQPRPSASELYQIYRPQSTTPVGNLLADYGYGESRYDKYIGSIPQLDNIGDVRALNQSSFDKFAAGITKGIGLAATTFLDGTAGLIYGIGQGISEGRVSALWDNDLSNALQDFNKGMEEVLPNYKTKEEQERPWWQNMGTANFWADGFLKNLGFTVGAFYSGNAWTQGLKALGWVKKATSAQVIGSLLSGFNEGRIEANNGQREFMDKERMMIQSAKEKRAQEIAAMPGYSDEEKIAMLKELDHNAELQEQKALERGHKMGLATLIGNTVLLSIDNMWQFGKLYSRGFKNAKGLANRIETGIAREGIEDVVERGVKKYAAKNTSKAAKVARGFSNGLVEGNEEMAQAFISETAGYWMSPDSPDAYYNAILDPNAKMETRGFLSAAAEGLNNSYGSGDRWEEFAIGMFTGLLGMPTFGKLNNSDANTWIGKGKAVGISGGLIGEMRSATQKEAEANEAVQVMNKYLDKLRTNAGYFSQSQSFTNAMDGFAAENNNFEYKNMANNDDFAAISRFARTGRLEDLKEMVNQDFENMSDEQLADIAINTTPNIKINPDGTVLYEDSINNNTETGGWRNPADGKLMSESEEGRAKMREDLAQKRDKILHEIDEYEKSVETVRALGNNSLSEDQVNELAWYDWKVKMFNDRFNSIKESQKTFLGALRSSLAEYISDNLADTNNANLDELGGRQEGESEESYKQRLKNRAKEKKKTLDVTAKENPIAALQTVEDYLTALFSADSALKFGSLVANNMDIVNAIDSVPNRRADESFADYNKRLQEAGNNVVLGSILEELSGLTAQEYKDRIKDVADAGRIAKAAKGFNDRYKEFSENPLKLVQNRSKLETKAKEVVDKINEKRTQKQSDSIAKRFDFTSNISSIAKTLEDNMKDIEAVGGLNVWMDKLPEDQRKKIKKAITFQKGVKGIKDAFDSTDKEGLKEDRMRRIAKSLIDEAAEKSDNLDDLEETANKLLNTSTIDEQVKKVAGNLSDSELLETVNGVKMAIKEVFKDNFEAVKKAAKQFEAMERANEKEEQRNKKAEKAASKVKEEEKPIDKNSIPKDTKPLIVPGGMVSSKNAPEDTIKFNTRSHKESGTIKKGKGPKENRPQLSEYFLHAVDEETYLDYIKKHGGRPKLEGGYTEKDYDKYIEEVYNYLKKEGAFEYVRHHLKKGEKLEFFIDDELNQKAGTTVVLIRTGKGQIVGSMPTDIDFKSIPYGEKVTMQKLEPEKYELFSKIVDAHKNNKQEIIIDSSYKKVSKAGKEVISKGQYKLKTHDDGITNVSIDNVNAARRVTKDSLQDIGITLDDIIGKREDFNTPENYDKAIEDFDSYRITKITVAKDGAIQYIEFDSPTGDTAASTNTEVNAKIVKYLFPELSEAVSQSKQLAKNGNDSKKTLYTTGVEALRGGSPSWASTNFSVASIFENTGESPVIGIVNSSGFIEMADRRVSSIDENVLPGELKTEGQVYILIPSSSGKFVPALAYGKPIHEIVGTSIKGEIFENDGWQDDWYIQNMVEVLQKAPTRINAENSLYNEELFRWLRVNNMSIRAKYKDNGETKTDNSRDLNKATYLLISYDKDDGKTDYYTIPLENKQVTREAALKAIKTIAFRNKNITTNVILGEMNSSNSANYVSHISNYLFTNIVKGRVHTINDYFVYKSEDFNRKKNEKKMQETPQERKDKNNIKTTTIEVDGVNYEVGQNNSSIKNIDTGKAVSMGSEEYFKVVSALNTKSSITIASDTPITPQGTTPITKEELEKQLAAMNGEKPAENKSDEESKKGKPQPKKRGFLETSRVSNEPRATERQLKRELRRTKRMLPALSEEGRMSIVKGLIRVTSEDGNPIEAYGRFVDGMVQISNEAPMGTSYHEAFHYVVDVLLSDEEKENMFQEAERQFNTNDRMELEERLAEEFRTYMNKKTDMSLRGIIRRLFEKLKNIISGTKNKKTSLDTLFNDIYGGSFRNRIGNSSNDINARNVFKEDLEDYRYRKTDYSKLDSETKEYLKARGISEEEYQNLAAEQREFLLHCM